MTQLHELSALAQAEAIRAGEVSPVELVDHYLDRIAAYDGGLGAFVTVSGDSAREQAKDAERRVRDAAGGLPPLHGVPTAIKDLAATADTATTFGSRAYQGFVPAVDAHVVHLLRAAGTISLGKTNTPEFGLSAYTDNDVRGPARTPWDLELTAGGSSGGAAAAVAAGLVPFAHGSDGGGSLRIPASACGVFGFKPSRGRVSNGPLGSDVTGLTVQGPIGRAVADAAAMLDAIAVPMPGDPHWAPPLPPGESFLAASRREPGRLRIARFADPGLPGVSVDPSCLAAYDEATVLLADLGHDVVEVANPFGAEFADAFVTTWAVQSLLVPVDPADEQLLRPITRWWRERGRATAAAQFLAATSQQQLGSRSVVAALAGYDAVLTPTLAQPPQAVTWFSDASFTAEIDRQTAFSPYTAAWNITGQPAASLPLHWTADGIPIGVSLAGPPAGDALLLSLCAQVENARPWAHRWPSLSPSNA